jgi:hypothetical protein
MDTFKDLKCLEGSVFGDLMFLDTIKGSALSGQAKVKCDGADPFIGHATLLGKQVNWHPIKYIEDRSKTFLWARNYMAAIRLGSSMASLPFNLGGAALAIGPKVSFEEHDFRNDKLPWYEAMLLLEEREFLKYFLLLRGIYQTNPKGFSWLNDFEVITTITENCQLYRMADFQESLPEWVQTAPTQQKLSAIEKGLNLVSFTHLAS